MSTKKNKDSFKYSEAEIDQALQVMKYIKEKSKNNPEFVFDKELSFFLKVMKFLTPQSYGSRVQNKLIESLNFTKVEAKLDKGDYKDGFGQHYEVKISLITETNEALNMVQIRPWQKIYGYICIAIDLRDIDPKIYTFKLTKKEMEKECIAMNASSAHGTKKAIEDNKNVELRLGLTINDENTHFLRWKKKYLTKFNFNDA